MGPMERGGDHDDEIGRGRQHDSSSSMESSPAQGSKRSFSPTSDDLEAMAQEMAAENELIPPSERPLLRQPLGFSIDKQAKSINTYEASISAPTKNGVFLPGQEVPSNMKKLKGKKRCVKKQRPRRPEAYAGQTSRFRLDTYNPTPSGDPPANYGSGPYTRGPTTETRPDLPATASHQGRSSSSTASSSNAMVSFRRSSQESPFTPKISAAAASKGKSTQPLGVSPFACSRFQQFTNDIGSSTLGGPYYRHNYESQHKLATPSPSQRQSGQSETQKKWGPIARSQGYPPAASTSSRGTDNEEAEGQARRPPLRMVTVLIQDIRSGVTDHQLAEVRVPLKASDDPQDGFWADAKDISEQLQASASRIDGPARAYTLRGKYRQFFLRVSADNADEFISANVVIQPDRTLDVVVEMLQPPGAPPVVPNIPKELWPLRDESEELEDRIDVDPRENKQSASSEGSRKRRTSPSFDDYVDYHRGDSYASSNKAPRLDDQDMSPRVKPNRSILDNAPPNMRQSYAKELRSRSPENSPPSLSYPHPGSVSPSERDHHQPQRSETNTEKPREDHRSTKALFV